MRIVVDSGRPTPPDEIAIGVDDRSSEIDNWHTIGSGSEQIWFASASFVGLRPGQTYDVQLFAGGNEIDRASATTLPGASDKVGLIFGSCFDGDQPAALVRRLYDQLEDLLAQAGAPHINIWLGDQVYVDAPWQRGFRTRKVYETGLSTYRAAWGLDGSCDHDGLSYAMSKASNWFLPDDHEFWNGFPLLSPSTLPAKLPHPRDFERFDQTVNPAQIQQIDIGSLLVVLVDTRWHRTIRKTGLQAGFMADADLEALAALLATEDRTICLALSRPLLRFPPHRGLLRGKAEYSRENYTRQYIQLWSALNRRAERARPTIVLGGDMHQQSIKTALDQRRLEFVSSPLAKLAALGETTSGISALAIDTSDPSQPVVEIHVIRSLTGQLDAPVTQRFKWVDGWKQLPTNGQRGLVRRREAAAPGN